MSEGLGWLMQQLLAAPPLVVYLVLGAFASLENLVPPIPADVVVLFGGLLAGRGGANLWVTFLVVWGANVAGALLVYLVGRRFGPGFFASRWGQFLLKPQQLASLDAFYRRYGFGVIFASRFLPMFRAVVPVFAGISRLGFWRTALPLALASGLWYGALVYLGAAAGRNWEELLRTVDAAGRWFWLAAALAALGVAGWWRRSR